MAVLSLYLVALAAVILVITQLLPKKKTLPPGTKLPPGPSGKPIIGSMLDIPPQHSWLKFKEYIDRYGPIVRLNLAGQDHVILGTDQIANDLLRERGTIYSDREQLPAACLLTDFRSPLFLPYGDLWRKERRFLHQGLMSSVAPTYTPQQELEGTRMLRDMINKPQDYEVLFEQFSVGVAMRIIYGLRLGSGHDYEARSILEIVHEFERVASPGAYLVDLFPCMMWIPDFLAPWKRHLKAGQRREEKFYTELFNRTRKHLADGMDNTCWARTWLEDKGGWGFDEPNAVYVLGGAFEAAGGTTAASMMSFVLAIVRNPQWFPKLQEEIDRVVGPDRMPNLDDMPQLPMVRACVKETLRYYPVTAGGVPHKLTKDDIYNGYFLKKGTLVHPTAWCILRDAEVYPEPETFNPTRWLDPSFPTYKEPLTTYPNLQMFAAFGVGRRMCPGLNIAERSLNLQVALLAWGCDISRARDAAGKEIIPPHYDFVEGFNVQPKRFKFELRARSRAKGELIEKLYQQSLKDDPLL